MSQDCSRKIRYIYIFKETGSFNPLTYVRDEEKIGFVQNDVSNVNYNDSNMLSHQ